MSRRPLMCNSIDTKWKMDGWLDHLIEFEACCRRLMLSSAFILCDIIHEKSEWAYVEQTTWHISRFLRLASAAKKLIHLFVFIPDMTPRFILDLMMIQVKVEKIMVAKKINIIDLSYLCTCSCITRVKSFTGTGLGLWPVFAFLAIHGELGRCRHNNNNGRDYLSNFLDQHQSLAVKENSKIVIYSLATEGCLQ